MKRNTILVVAIAVVAVVGLAKGCGRDSDQADLRDKLERSRSLPDDGQPFTHKNLFEACRESDFHDVNRHIKRGADPNELGLHSGYSLAPMHVAARRGNPEIAALLLSANGDPNLVGAGSNTPLYFAADAGHLPVVKLLVAGGANIDGHPAQAIKPLQGAIHRGHLDIVAYLLEQGADANVEAGNHATPLMILSELTADDDAAVKCVDLLIEHGADVNHRNPEGLTALHAAVAHQRHTVAAVLLGTGADVDSATEDLGPPMQLAVHLGDIQMVQMLVQHGASPTDWFPNGNSPLSMAAMRGDFAMVNALVAAGGDLNAPVTRGGDTSVAEMIEAMEQLGEQVLRGELQLPPL